MQENIQAKLSVIFLIISATVVPVTTVFAEQHPQQSIVDEAIDQAYKDTNQIIMLHGQPAFATTDSPDLIVLSHGFNTEIYPEIVGEVQNNGTRSYDKYDVDIVANFRDASGKLVSSETGYIDAETLSPGDSSAFNVVSFDEQLPDKATTYDLIVEDERVVVGAPLEGDSSGSDSTSDSDSDSDSDSEGEESGNN